MTTPPSVRRGRGRPARVDRARIVEAARTIDPSTLSMQAVADVLGVDRKTIHYHIRDREELVEFIAREAFREEMSAVVVDPTTDWPEALRSFGVAVHSASVAAGSTAAHPPLNPHHDLADFAPAEVALGALVRAGFDELTSAHLLATVAVLATGFARDLVIERRSGPRAQRDAVRRVLQAHGDGELPMLEHLVRGDIDVKASNEANFRFALDMIVSGAEQILGGRPA